MPQHVRPAGDRPARAAVPAGERLPTFGDEEPGKFVRDRAQFVAGNRLFDGKAIFEDFLTRRFEPDDENRVEIYLRRRGWKERALARNYMAALQTSA
jgi:hypothetical protein